MSADAGQQLIQRAGRGGLWLLGGHGAHALIRLGSNIILAKLLFPEAFGLMGMITVLLVGLELFSDTGIGPSIVRSPRGTEQSFLDTAWTVQAARGVMLAALCCLIAPLFARIYEEPRLTRLVTIAALTPLLQGLRSTSLFLADRLLVQGRKTIIGLICQTAGIGTMLIWAALEHSVDALLAGWIVSTGLYTLLSHLCLPGRLPRLRLERSSLKELFGFGRWIFLSTALSFLAMQADRLFLGYVLLFGPLGLYFLANSLLELITNVLSMISNSIIYPAWVESERLAPAEHARRLQRSRAALNAVGMAGIVVLATLVPALFRLFYDDRYQEVATLLQLLCASAWLLALRTTAISAVLAFGDSRALSAANLILFLVKLPLSIAGFYLGGLTAFIVGAALGNAVGMLPLFAALDARGCRLFQADLRESARCAALLLAGIFLPRLASPLGPVALLAAEGFAAAALGLLAIYPARSLLLKLRP